MVRRLLIFLILNLILVMTRPVLTQAQAVDITWSSPLNISNSPDFTSTDPFLLADPAGGAHLFWAEKVVVQPAEQPDTIMYTYWDGALWSAPVDLFFAPASDGTPIASYPHAVIDDNQRIHLIWLQEPNAPNYAVYYSSAPASKAGTATAWLKPVVLAADLTGSKYSIHIAFTPPETLHVAYARIPTGEGAPSEQRAVSYLRSTDGGATWSESIDVFTAPSLDTGASDIRLLTVPPDKVFLSWTLWDSSGNGQAIYFARSLDNGLNWSRPIRLAVNQVGEYERDWNNLAYLGNGRIAAMWEGGFRAYRYGMYSEDDGATWTEPIDTFPWLIGDNGFIEFAHDSLGNTHLFVAQRIREGNESRGELFGLWHSVWEGGARWSDPTLVSRNKSASQGMTNPKVTIVNGNQVVTAWYGTGVYEIWVATGVINRVPALTPLPWPTPDETQSVDPSVVGQSDVTPTVLAPTAQPIPPTLSTELKTKPGLKNNLSTILLVGVMPAFIVVFLITSLQFVRRNRKK